MSVLGRFVAKSVANTTHRFDQHVELAEFLAERADVNINRSLERIRIFTAATVHQFVAAEGATGGMGQRPKQPELGRCQDELFSVRLGDVIRAVNRDAMTFECVTRLFVAG